MVIKIYRLPTTDYRLLTTNYQPYLMCVKVLWATIWANSSNVVIP